MIVKQGKRLVVHPPSGSLHCVFNTQFMCLKCDILSYLVMLLPHIVGFYVTWGIIMQPADLSSSGSQSQFYRTPYYHYYTVTERCLVVMHIISKLMLNTSNHQAWSLHMCLEKCNKQFHNFKQYCSHARFLCSPLFTYEQSSVFCFCSAYDLLPLMTATPFVVSCLKNNNLG